MYRWMSGEIWISRAVAAAASTSSGVATGFKVVERFARAVGLEHRRFRLRIRIADVDPDEETVQLAHGEGESALVLERVLGRYDHEGLRKPVGGPVDGHLALFHRLQQG